MFGAEHRFLAQVYFAFSWVATFMLEPSASIRQDSLIDVLGQFLRRSAAVQLFLQNCFLLKPAWHSQALYYSYALAVTVRRYLSEPMEERLGDVYLLPERRRMVDSTGCPLQSWMIAMVLIRWTFTARSNRVCFLK